jgi:hypothetical protein
MLCNVISSIPGSRYSLTNYHSLKDSVSIIKFNKHQLILQNSTIKFLTRKFLSTWDISDDLWIDDSGITFPLDLVINFDEKKAIDMNSIKAKLLEYGIKVEKKVYPYPVMILNDLK